MRRLLILVLFVGVAGFIYHYFGSLLTFRSPDLTPGQIQTAYAECALEYGLPLEHNGLPPTETVPIETLSTKDRNTLLGCALKSGSYNFVRWALQKPKEMLSIESKIDQRWPVEAVARWVNGPAAVDTLKLILEPNDALWKINSSASLMVALYEAATVDAAKYLAEKYNYLLPEDNRQFFAPEDYPKYLGLTLAQYHAYSGRLDVAEYFASKGSRVAIPGMNFRQWILANDKSKKILYGKLDAFLTEHGVPRDDIAVATAASGLSTDGLADSAAATALSASAPKFPSTNGYPLMLGDSGHALWVEGNTAQRWDPASNALTDRLDLPFMPDSAVETAQGIVIVAKDYVALLANGKSWTADLLVARYKQTLVALADQSVLILGGHVSVAPNGHKVRTNAVERVSFSTAGLLTGDHLTVERMPDLPGSVRTAFSTVALVDGRAMVLGGTDSPYVGCSPCTAETWIFDPNGKTWSVGPKLNEPRADMSATLLPDGSVLAAGGWTPEHGWGGAGSRTVERWYPQSNAFVPLAARMTSYMSMHRALWLPGAEGRLLVLAGGNSAAIQVYDVEHDIWQVAGETCQGTENNGRRVVIPMIREKQYGLIVQNSSWCPAQNAPWELVQLRLPLGAADMKSTARSFSGDSGITLYRGGMAFLPGQNDGYTLALGGTIHAGMNNYVITSAADALWPDGHIQSLPGFIHARSGANLFRLQDGALLLAGGQVNVGGYDHAVEKASAAEWLSGNAAPQEGRWQPLDAAWAQNEALGQTADGSLVAVDSGGGVSRFRISANAQGKPQMETGELPSLHQPRLFKNRTDLIVRGLPDGRIIVAGGEMQNKQLAVMHEDSLEQDAPDEYLRIGESEPTDDYEIYEPGTGQWRLSAASRAYGGLMAVYDDGSVVRLYAKEKEPNEQGPPPEDPEMEISSADGRTWSELKTGELPIIGVKYSTRMFVLHDELFIAGELLHSNIQTLQWFNGATRRWETLWQSTPQQNWRDNVGRIIIRQLANNKRVMLPVAGL